jgi:hypothetical protein
MDVRETSVRRFFRGGSEGNARLTGMTGLVLLLLAVEGVTILAIRPLLCFFVWLGAFGVHVLVYALRVPGLVAADWAAALAPRERRCVSGSSRSRSSSA